ncbi:MAG TPA: LytTR family DNA-binding domain-containing protein [Gemmatimonadales bacterium]|nr:LytTR family DNA-binding domain-containing protein [Gemmatimonadales bacterium]
MIRTLIVDDEPLAREGLRVRLGLERDIALVGEAADGPTAIELIRRELPDLVLLDVQMPGMDGFEVLERIAEDCLPSVIFVTAHDRYAVKAFEVHAVDYLLKPLDGARLREAVERVRRTLAAGPQGTREGLVNLLASREKGGERTHVRRWAVREDEHFVLLRAEEVDWIEAAANYVRFHARGKVYLLRATMTQLEQELDPRRFARIHRSTIVNLDRVREIRPEWHGDYDVQLTTGDVLRLGRRYRDGLLK